MTCSKFTYVWFRLETGGEDLELEVLENYEPFLPDWLQVERYDVGMSYDEIMRPNWHTAESGVGWCFAETWLQWALRSGIAPGQPFLVRFDEFEHIVCHSVDGTEYDTEYFWEVVDVEPWTHEQSLLVWKKTLEFVREYRKAAIERMQELVERQKNDVEAMYLKYDAYWVRYYDEQSPPDGVIVRLCTNHHQVEGFAKSSWGALIEARDDGGNHAVAMEKLLKLVREHLPHLSEEQIKNLPVRRF